MVLQYTHFIIWIWIKHSYVAAPKKFYHGILQRNYRKMAKKLSFFKNSW